jgi:hypothetical protein
MVSTQVNAVSELGLVVREPLRIARENFGSDVETNFRDQAA